MNLVRNLAILAFLALFGQGANAATTLLPNGKQCFAGVNGAYSSGSVNMFIPNTTTPKATWQDPTQTAMNTQPIQLDANGCATIYGIGSYRQQLFDGPVVGGVATGNLIWDQLTTDTSAYNSVFWAGTASGTPNVITIVDPGFNGTDGTVVQFVALATNTGSTTINPSGFGAILVQKSTTGGPVSLVGGEIVQGNVISAVYSSASNTFQLLNAVIQSVSGASAPLCGATGLRITNGATTPNTIISMVADQVVMETSAGIVQSRNNVTLNAINISTGNTASAANGMDGEAPGTSAWLNIWAIDNGAAIAGLVSTSATAPNLPNGYTFKCRLGAMRVDSSGNLLRTMQLGNQAQYVVTTGSNVPTPAVLATGAASVWAPVSTATNVPPTATRIMISYEAQATGLTVNLLLAPNNNYPTATIANNVYGMVFQATGLGGSLLGYADILLESPNVYWGNNNAADTLYTLGWRDKVNAN